MRTHCTRVAVVGAGAAGLCVARELLRHTRFAVTVFEQHSQAGGTWLYGSPHSNIYAGLHTNLPKDVMAFRAMPFPADVAQFPPHSVVQAYIEQYAAGVPADVVRYGATVEALVRGPAGWRVCVAGRADEQFDAVVIANGHFTKPVWPELAGLDAFRGAVMHSRAYKSPDSVPEACRRIVVLGSGPSGLDISRELSGDSRRSYVFLCARNLPNASSDTLAARFGVQVRGWPVRVEASRVVFEDGVLDDVDAIVVATGYQYEFPFLGPDAGIELTVDADGRRVRPLWKHLVHADDASLAFVGLLWKVAPFPLFEFQAKFLAALWDGQIEIPDDQERRAEADRILADWDAAEDPRMFHRMAQAQFDYCDDLAALCGTEPVEDWRRDGYRNAWEQRREALGY